MPIIAHLLLQTLKSLSSEPQQTSPHINPHMLYSLQTKSVWVPVLHSDIVQFCSFFLFFRSFLSSLPSFFPSVFLSVSLSLSLSLSLVGIQSGTNMHKLGKCELRSGKACSMSILVEVLDFLRSYRPKRSPSGYLTIATPGIHRSISSSVTYKSPTTTCSWLMNSGFTLHQTTLQHQWNDKHIYIYIHTYKHIHLNSPNVLQTNQKRSGLKTHLAVPL